MTGTPRGATAVPSSRTARLLFVGVAVLVSGAFAEACFGLFLLYDDPMIVSENPALRGGLADALRWAFLDDMGGNWVPVAALTHVVDVAMFGFDPFFHHLTSVLFHAAAAGAFAVFLLRVTGSPVASALGALLWAVHPMRVESVAWIAERRDVVSGFFLMLVLLAWERWARAGDRRHYALALVLALLGLLSKATLVTLPVLLLIVDMWPLRRHGAVPWRQLLVEKVPFLGLGGIVAIVTVSLQSQAGAVVGSGVVAWGARVENAIVSLGRYAMKTVWPVDLIIPVGAPHGGWPASTVLGVAAGLVVAAGLGVFLARRGRAGALAAGAWFVVAMGPMLGLIYVGHAAMAHRYSYVPHVLVAVAISVAVARVTPAIARRVALALTGVVVASLAAATVREVPVWRDTRTLFTRTVVVDPRNAIGWFELASVELHAGRPDLAVEPARRAAALDGMPVLQHGLIVALGGSGDHKGAVEVARRLLTAYPDDADARARLAISLLILEDFAAAREEATRARQSNRLSAELAAELARAEAALAPP